MENKEIVESILGCVYQRTQDYLEELKIHITDCTFCEVIDKQELNTHSVIVSIIGDIDVSFIISYDDTLLNKITEQFLEGESHSEKEFTESLAMEFANIVISNGLSKLDRTKSLHITTPLLIEQAKHLSSNKNSIILISKIQTKYGNLLLQCIHSKQTIEKKKTVLIVDDSLIMREKLFNAIEDLGYSIIGTANNGQLAIHLANKFKPDIITMDITMPDISGIEAMQEIRKSNLEVKIIMVTASGQEDNILQSISAGASSYLVKPIDKSKLEKALKECYE